MFWCFLKVFEFCFSFWHFSASLAASCSAFFVILSHAGYNRRCRYLLDFPSIIFFGLSAQLPAGFHSAVLHCSESVAALMCYASFRSTPVFWMQPCMFCFSKSMLSWNFYLCLVCLGNRLQDGKHRKGWSGCFAVRGEHNTGHIQTTPNSRKIKVSSGILSSFNSWVPAPVWQSCLSCYILLGSV